MAAMIPACDIYRNDTLLQRSLEKVAKHVMVHESNLGYIPPNLKDKLLDILSKRGLLNDATLDQLLHSKVKVLDLSESIVTDRTLSVIAAKCPQLVKIDLNSAKASRTEITPSGVITLVQGCRQLEVIYLRRCLRMTDDAVVEIAVSCPRLRYLNIGGCQGITDRSLLALGQNSQHLKSVNFSKSQVTDEGVFGLVNGPCSASLKEVHMDGCTMITDEAVEAVTEFCPNISILLFHGCPLLTERSRIALEGMMNKQTKVKQVTWTIY